MSQSPAHVTFEGVSKRYTPNQPLVVDQLDLQIQQGEFLTLLGASGSGKTTCLMMLAGFEAPTSGRILVQGQPIESLPPRQRGIGVVFQHYALFPHMTVRENLAFPLEVRRFSRDKIDARVQQVLRMIRLEGLENRQPAALSGGQQQRVAIARALVFEPSLVLMDEPLGALDRRLREDMQFEIRQMQRDLGITVLYVTHDQEEAMVMSDRIAVFNQGRIEQIAPPEVLYEEPERAFVANFIGENNLLTGCITEIEQEICTVLAGQTPIKGLQVSDSSQVGDEVTLAIRPERISLNPEPGLYANEVDAEVSFRSFLGDHLHLRLSVLGQFTFMVKLPNTIGQGGILEGDKIRIGWAQTDCRVLSS